ncbi:MAG TPA: GerMN domain-containing protein, partial [Treponemataceae bacterium]|nr:GerMN domain-containing protein [Treponemataceae bacterium]
SLPLFPRNTRSLSTALVGKTLYVNLSSEALNILDEASTNKKGAALFRKNVFRNLKNIDIIQIYIDGSSIYENEGF